MGETADWQPVSLAYARESASLLLYAAQAEPWAGPAQRPAVEAIRRMAAAEREELDRLGDLLRGAPDAGPPREGSFPAEFTRFNYVAVGNLLPRVLAEAREGLELLEESGHPALAPLIDLRREHVTSLAKLAASLEGSGAG